MLTAMWDILLALAPWMLVGMTIAGALHVLLPANFVHRHLGGRGGVAKAVALGVPLPLCSCGVIPAGLGLRKDGASRGASIGFLISTPQTGVDSVLVSAAFLGWPFAIFKVAAAFATGLVGGWLTDAWAGPGSREESAPAADAPADRRGFVAGFEHGFMLLQTIWRWLVVGIVLSAAIEVLLPEGFFAGLSGYGSLVPVAVSLAISLPLYVCAVASVPIAASLVAGGMPAGAALVFLMAGPATNIATIGAIHRGLGARALTVYLVTIVVGSAACGLALDGLISVSPTSVLQHHDHSTWWELTGAVVLLALLAVIAAGELRSWLRGVIERRSSAYAASAPIELAVDGMTCNGCVSRLERTLREQAGVTSVAVSLDPGRAVVRGEIDEGRVRSAIEDAGFTATGLS